MDLPEIPPFRKKDLPSHCHDSHGSAAPPSPHCDNGLFGVPPATPESLPHEAPPTANLPHETPPNLPDVLPATLGLLSSASLPHESPPSTPDVHQQIQETMEQELAPFVPSMGAWSKPLVLKFPPPCTPPEPSTPHSYDLQLVQSQIENFWPSLEEGTHLKQKKSLLKGALPSLPNLPVSKLPPPELKEDGSLRFPWAARMNPATRNLYRASRPTFRIDGTPEIVIPTKVLQLGPENIGEYVIGQFHRCSAPSGGLIHAVVNRLWGRSCKITSRKLGESSYLFHVPHKDTRQWIIQRSVWHVDDCLMFVAPWNPIGSFKIPEISTVPAWVTLTNIPTCCYSRLGISHIASGLGEPMLTHKPKLDPFNIGEAKILVEIELDKNFPKQIALDDKLGNIYLVDVVYSWIPSTCERCGSLGHKAKRCLLKEDKIDPALESNSVEANVDIPIVDIDSVLENNVCLAMGSKEPITSEVQQVFVSSKETSEKNKASDLQAADQLSAKELDPHKTMNLPQDMFDQPQYSMSPQVAISGSTGFCQSFSDSKIFSASTLAGSTSAQIFHQVMEEVPSSIIINEGVTLSENDPSSVTPLSTESTQEFGDMESDFCITEYKDEFGNEINNLGNLSVTRGGRLIKPTQKYQEMEWKTARGKGKRGRRGRES